MTGSGGHLPAAPYFLRARCDQAPNRDGSVQRGRVGRRPVLELRPEVEACHSVLLVGLGPNGPRMERTTHGRLPRLHSARKGHRNAFALVLWPAADDEVDLPAAR